MTDSSFKDAHGRSVVAADSAETLGEVKALIVDASASRVDGIHVAGGGRSATIIPWSSVRSFGADAVIADAADALQPVTDERETQAVKGKLAALGSRVLTTSGFSMGTTEDVFFDAATGNLTEVLTEQGTIEASRIRSLGSYALIVEPD